MSIEFRCEKCQFLLRTGEDSAGKNARCPQCGNIQLVPTAASGGTQAASPPFVAPSTAANTTASANPFAVDPSPNPYEPTAAFSPAPQSATNIRSKIVGPGDRKSCGINS